MNYDLIWFVKHLTEQRDEYLDLFAEFGDRADRTRAKAFAQVLSMLHTDTNGEFGQPLAEQPGGAS